MTGGRLLLPHHRAWLEKHPERSADWLRRQTTDGFHVHHVDGDHANNHPDNLVLIEGFDHMGLHGLFRLKRYPEHMMKAGAKGRKSRWANMTEKQKKAWGKRMAKSRWKEMKRRAKQRKATHKARKTAT